MPTPSWLTVTPREAPLIVSLPHTGTDIPDVVAPRLTSRWLALKDTDWWIDRLYGFADELGATVIRTAISRTAIDVNRDPSGTSLYPGQNTTGLCPVETFDGEPLYAAGDLASDDVAARRRTWFDPYHAALGAEIARLRARCDTVVVYDCHSIRSVIPRLFDGELPNFNIGSNDGTSCAPGLTEAIETICDATGRSRVTNGRFKGGYITRHHAAPARGVHAIQMELACRGYLDEPVGPVTDANWPVPYDAEVAAPMGSTLRAILGACLAFAQAQSPTDGRANA